MECCNQRFFSQKLKMLKSLYFSFLFVFGGVLNIWCFFLYGKLSKHCCQAKTDHLVSQQCLASIINKTPIFLTKWPPLATTIPSWSNTIIGTLVYLDILSDLRSRPEQSHLPICSISEAWLSKWSGGNTLYMPH